MKSIVSSLSDALDAVGAVLRRDPLPGRWTRADVIGKHGRADASIYAFKDGHGGMVWNWKTGERVLWFIDAGRKMSRDERERYRLEAHAAMRRAKLESEASQMQVARLAVKIMGAAAPAPASFPYLRRKHVEPVAPLGCMDADAVNAIIRAHSPDADWTQRLKQPATGALMQGCVLLVPIFDAVQPASLINVEFISDDGAKTVLAGGRCAGGCWRPEGLDEKVLRAGAVGVAEGIATALTLVRTEGLPIVAARYCANLKACATALRSRFPGAEIVVFGDGDPAGAPRAQEAALAVDAATSIPEFTDADAERFREMTGGSKPTDWNDYMILKGVI